MVSAESILGSGGLCSCNFHDSDLCSFCSLTVASAAVTEETEGLDLLPAEPRASPLAPVDCEDELADDECRRPSCAAAGDDARLMSSVNSHIGSSLSARLDMMENANLQVWNFLKDLSDDETDLGGYHKKDPRTQGNGSRGNGEA